MCWATKRHELINESSQWVVARNLTDEVSRHGTREEAEAAVEGIGAWADEDGYYVTEFGYGDRLDIVAPGQTVRAEMGHYIDHD